MKKNQSSILIVGHDEHLLATRQWVLQSRGYQVLTVSTPDAIRTVPSSAPIRLVMLCHTLTPEETDGAGREAGERWPGVKCLNLIAEESRAPTGILGQLLHTMDGPGKLLAMVSELVGSSAELQRPTQP